MIESDLVIGPISVKRLYSVNQLLRMNSGQVFGITKSIKKQAAEMWRVFDKEDLYEYPLTYHQFLYIPEKNKMPDSDCSSWLAKYIRDGATGILFPDDSVEFVANTVLHTPEHMDIPKPQYWAAFTANVFDISTK